MLSDGQEQAGKQVVAKRLPIKKGAGRLRAKNPTGKKGNLERQQQLAQIVRWGRHNTNLGKANFFIAQMQMVDQLSLTLRNLHRGVNNEVAGYLLQASGYRHLTAQTAVYFLEFQSPAVG